MLKCVIFDVDGTLINTEKAILLSLQKTLEETTSRLFTLEDLSFTFGIPGKEALRKLEVPDVDHAMSLWVRHTYEYASEVALFDGVLETLISLKEKGALVGIVTSQARSELEELLDFFKIRDCFEILISSSDTMKHKPNPEPILKFLEKAHISASEAIYIGDTIYDQQSALASGVPFALALWGTKEPEMRAEFKLRHPSEILSFF